MSELQAAQGGMVDQSAIKINQIGIVVTVLVAFIGSAFWWALLWLVPALALVLLIGTAAPRLALFKQTYLRLLRPAGLVRPRPVRESGSPHNFAQGMGGVVLAIASILLLAVPALGLALSLLVALLAAVNIVFGYCLGCQIYFQLARRGLIKA